MDARLWYGKPNGYGGSITDDRSAALRLSVRTVVDEPGVAEQNATFTFASMSTASAHYTTIAPMTSLVSSLSLQSLVRHNKLRATPTRTAHTYATCRGIAMRTASMRLRSTSAAGMAAGATP